MVELVLNKLKNLGLNRQVLDALPTAVVGGTFEGSVWHLLAPWNTWATLLNHIVPHGQQLSLLFLRITTNNANGATFRIVQTNPATAGLTGTVEGFPVVGSVPPFTNGATTVRDYPFLEAAGAEVLHGSLKDPIHVFEGSVDFGLAFRAANQNVGTYGLVWWGVEETPEG